MGKLKDYFKKISIGQANKLSKAPYALLCLLRKVAGFSEAPGH